MFVLAHNPRAKVLLVPPDALLFVDDYRPADRDAIVAAVARHEGPEQAEAARLWLAAQPAGCKVAREPSGEVAGIMHYVRLDLASAEELAADPQALAAWRASRSARSSGDHGMSNRSRPPVGPRRM